ncbi:F-box/kelch-repeat protein-like protein [Tanacetum coccineum]
MEIIKRAPDVTSLIRFRSVSKPWKLFIDSSEFISGFGARYTDPHRLIIRYNELTNYYEEQKLICLVDDDNIFDALTRKQLHLFAPSIGLYKSFVVGASNGLFCLFGYGFGRNMLVLWNPCVRRSVRIVLPYVPYKRSDFGFGICPITNDPSIVRISYFDDSDMMNIPWQVEVFKLSLGVWKTISEDLPCPTIRVWGSEDVAIGKLIYWVAVDVKNPESYMVMSFDLVTEKFGVVDFPDSIAKLLSFSLSISKLRDSLVIYGSYPENGKPVHGVWKMEHDGSFTKLFSINTLDSTLVRVSAFRMSGEPVIETIKSGEQHGLEVYDPCSKRINNLGIHGEEESLFVGSYMESLLLLNYSDGYVFS